MYKGNYHDFLDELRKIFVIQLSNDSSATFFCIRICYEIMFVYYFPSIIVETKLVRC